jgi:Flp pilus assembly CpaE family ATPase
VSSSALRLVLAVSPLEEDTIASALYDTDAIEVIASGADANELLVIGTSVTADAVLLSAALPGLDAGVTARLHASGLRLAGLLLDDDDAGALAGLDLDLILQPPFTASDLVEVGEERAAKAVSEPSMARRETSRQAGTARQGSVLAVVGSKGAPGASELAASFAALVARDWPVLLVECDGDGGHLALRLGADPREGSLLGPARALNANEANLESLLPRWFVGGERGWPAVLLGLPDPPTDLAEVSRAGVSERLLELLTRSFPLVVCDVGHRLRSGTQLDQAVRLHRELLTGADAVMLLIGSRQEQLDAGFAQIELLSGELGITPERLRIVVNGEGGPGAAAAVEASRAIDAELVRHGLAVDARIPWDERAVRASTRLGVPLALARPRGSYAKALRRLADAVLLPSVPQPAVRKHRLRPAPPIAHRAASVVEQEEVALPWRR